MEDLIDRRQVQDALGLKGVFGRVATNALIVLQLKDFPLNIFRSVTRPLDAGLQEQIYSHFYSR